MTEAQGDILILSNESILEYIELLHVQFAGLTEAFTVLRYMIGTAYMMLWFYLIFQMVRGKEK